MNESVDAMQLLAGRRQSAAYGVAAVIIVSPEKHESPLQLQLYNLDV